MSQGMPSYQVLNPQPVPQVPYTTQADLQAVRVESQQQFQALSLQLKQLADTLAPVPSPAPVETSYASEPTTVDPTKNMQSVAELDSTKKQNILLAGFETLNMSYLTGPIAEKPTKRVVFDMGRGGANQANFHDVVVSKGNVVLVYDTRFEGGHQFMPPNQSKFVEAGEPIEPIIVTVAESGQEYSVTSMGIQFTIGVLDIIVLIEYKEG